MHPWTRALLAVGLCLGATASQSAVVAGCTDFQSLNGTTTFPGTFVGTVGSAVGQVCQIGNIASNNVSSTGTFVNNTQSISIYSFYWGGGMLSIQERLGNNGLGKAVDIDLDALASTTSTSPQSMLRSIEIPFQSGPTSFFTLADHAVLAAGYYAIRTALAPDATDPTFQINFTPNAAAVPEPATIVLLAAPFALMLLARRRARPAV